MNTKYLVIADTYPYAYGAEYTLFGIFDTKQEAINFIIKHPTIKINDDIFQFIEDKDFIYNNYIKEFNGNPLYIGGYIE